jgi:hypothetical protein
MDIEYVCIYMKGHSTNLSLCKQKILLRRHQTKPQPLLKNQKMTFHTLISSVAIAMFSVTTLATPLVSRSSITCPAGSTYWPTNACPSQFVGCLPSEAELLCSDYTFNLLGKCQYYGEFYVCSDGWTGCYQGGNPCLQASAVPSAS